MPKNIQLTDEQYSSILRRMRNRIAAGLELKAIDSTFTGNKYTHCSWGLCTKDPAFWKRDEVLFPDRGPVDGMESPKYTQDHHICPFDPRPKDKRDHAGCFFKCLMFHGPRKDRNREKALELYDKAISVNKRQ